MLKGKQVNPVVGGFHCVANPEREIVAGVGGHRRPGRPEMFEDRVRGHRAGHFARRRTTHPVRHEEDGAPGADGRAAVFEEVGGATRQVGHQEGVLIVITSLPQVGAGGNLELHGAGGGHALI